MKTNIYITRNLRTYLTITLLIVFSSSFAQQAPHANFDATTGSYIDFGKGTNLNCYSSLSSSNKITITMWVKWTSKTDPNVGSWANILTLADSTGSGDNGIFWVQHNSDNTKFEFALTTTAGRNYIQSSTNPTNGTWYHIACVYDGSLVNKNMKLYINGIEEATSGKITANIKAITAASRLNMGRWPNPSNNYRRFFGNIDEVSVWNKALTAAQISQIKSNPESITGNSYNATGLISYWNFDNLSANDLSSCSNNGTVGGAVELPITLLFFNVEPENNNVKLAWSTATESNNDYFSIERSANGYEYEEIGSIKGYGFSNVINKYDFLDESPISGISYYRLKQTDFDGVSTYYDIKSVKIEKIENQEISIYPNPCTSFLNINFNQSVSKANIDIFNSNGQIILSHTVLEDNSFQVPVESLESGFYFVKIKVENQIKIERFVVE